MLVKYGASPPPGMPAISMLAPVWPPDDSGQIPGDTLRMSAVRSEEHTSELQSQSNLVCRLLLEKKKIPRSHQAVSMCSSTAAHSYATHRPCRCIDSPSAAWSHDDSVCRCMRRRHPCRGGCIRAV